MGAKGSGAPVAYPGAKLAKGWRPIDEQDKATYDAGQKMLSLIDECFRVLGRSKLQHITLALARVIAHRGILSELSMWVLRLEEELGK